MTLRIFLVFCFLYSNLLLAQGVQQEQLDSLLNVYKTYLKEDTTRVKLLHQIGISYKDINADSGLYYSNQSLILAQRLQYETGVFDACIGIGNNCIRLSQYSEALESYDNALQIASIRNHTEEKVIAMGNIANAHLHLNNYATSIEYYFKVLQEYEKMGKEPQQGLTLSNIGLAYIYMGQYTRAMEYLQRSVEIYEKHNDKYQVARVLGYMSTVYGYMEKPHEALSTFFKTLQLSKEVNNQYLIAGTIGDIGIIYYDLNNYDEAISYLKEAIELHKALNNTYSVAVSLRALGSAYNKADNATLIKYNINPGKRYKEAIKLINQSIDIAREMESAPLEAEDLLALTEVYETNQKYNLALETYKKYHDLQMKLSNETQQETIIKNEMQYHFDKKRDSLHAEQEKKNIIAQSRIQKQKNQRNSIALIAIVVIAMSTLSFILYNKKRNALQKEKETAMALHISELKQQALNAQMSDHFIGNAMDSINNFIENNDKVNASRYLIMFERLIRKILDNSFKNKISLQEELEITKHYIAIEQLRFEEGVLQYEINTDGINTEEIFLPPMTFQILAENALKHGLKKDKGGILKITAKQQGNYLVCTVEDNGIGRSQSLSAKTNGKRSSHGNSLVESLLKVNYQNEKYTSTYKIYDLYNDSKQATGTKVVFTLPVDS